MPFIFWPGIVDAYILPKQVYLSVVVVGMIGRLLWMGKEAKFPLVIPIGCYFMFLLLSGINAVNYYEFANQVSLDLTGIVVFWYVVNVKVS